MLKTKELRQEISNYKNNFEKICKSFVICEIVAIFAVSKRSLKAIKLQLVVRPLI